ncbi:formin-like protein 3 [Choloepus didactylus]|uniref:formin-like protein 3 n=1 Tax=Choloepus didactylus TaxID=27675 RepID=UPI00189E7F8D|nr:formin-like protein 3 [Choloepus didactylus]
MRPSNLKCHLRNCGNQRGAGLPAPPTPPPPRPSHLPPSSPSRPSFPPSLPPPPLPSLACARRPGLLGKPGARRAPHGPDLAPRAPTPAPAAATRSGAADPAPRIPQQPRGELLPGAPPPCGPRPRRAAGQEDGAARRRGRARAMQRDCGRAAGQWLELRPPLLCSAGPAPRGIWGSFPGRSRGAPGREPGQVPGACASARSAHSVVRTGARAALVSVTSCPAAPRRCREPGLAPSAAAGAEGRSPRGPEPAASPGPTTGSRCAEGGGARPPGPSAPEDGGADGAPGTASLDSPIAYFLLPPSDGAHELLPGASVIQICCQDLASLPVQHVALANGGDPKKQDTEEPKKRKGGWPKGKKRKPPRDLPAPRAPATGYVIFLSEQRSQLRAKHPDLPFTEITKMLAAQWAQLSQEKKQRYVHEAEEDKQCYIRELQAYQSSKAYRAFLQRRVAHKSQALCGTPGNDFESEGLDFAAINGDENKDLYCSTCRQFLSSLHNKKEHLLGKQHLQNLTGEFEKDSAEYAKRLESLEEEEGQRLNKGESEEEAECPHLLPLRGLIPEENFASLDLCLLQEFIFKLLRIKESELGELKRTLGRARAEQEALQRQLVEFQNQQQRLEVELAGLKTYGVILEKEFENLNMVLMLSHFGLQVLDTA